MSEQNRYQIARRYKTKQGWGSWIEHGWVESGDAWQDAIHKGIEDSWGLEACQYQVISETQYQVISETPSKDGRSGIIEIQVDTSANFMWVGANFKATIIDD